MLFSNNIVAVKGLLSSAALLPLTVLTGCTTSVGYQPLSHGQCNQYRCLHALSGLTVSSTGLWSISGVGNYVEKKELQDIARDESRVYMCSDYRALLDLKHLVGSKLCLRKYSTFALRTSVVCVQAHISSEAVDNQLSFPITVLLQVPGGSPSCSRRACVHACMRACMCVCYFVCFIFILLVSVFCSFCTSSFFLFVLHQNFKNLHLFHWSFLYAPILFPPFFSSCSYSMINCVPRLFECQNSQWDCMSVPR